MSDSKTYNEQKISAFMKSMPMLEATITHKILKNVIVGTHRMRSIM